MDVLKVHRDDNVLVALRNQPRGAKVRHQGQSYLLPDGIRAKHKIATIALAPGDAVIMYGVLVGRATQAIPPGSAITTENVVHASSEFAASARRTHWDVPDVTRWRGRSFQGYHRTDGQVGTANHWLVIPLVFCENRNIDVLRDAFHKELGYAQPDAYRAQVADLVRRHREGIGPAAVRELDLPEADSSDRLGRSLENRVFQNLSGIHFLAHDGGCGGTREDARALCALFAGYIKNANVAGATLLSLGCQHAQIALFKEELERKNVTGKPILIYEQQHSASEFAMLGSAIRDTFAALQEANQAERRPAPLSQLRVGVECGGSDGFSGLSANPAMGHVADLVIALGGQAILSEFPELCGVEQELIDRCENGEVADRFIRLMRTYAERAAAVGAGFDMNPSPGNIRDGLITDAMKSAGAAKKGGTSPVTAALGYAEYATDPGLALLCTPGNDVESTTGLAGAGANVILFSTGLGTPTGNPVTPVIKVATNTDLARRLPDIIDFDAGEILTGDATIEATGETLLEFVVGVASGEIEPKATGLGQTDFIPWKRGISL
jgi:altronate hydrolase